MKQLLNIHGKDVWVMRVPVISTSHITEKDHATLVEKATRLPDGGVMVSQAEAHRIPLSEPAHKLLDLLFDAGASHVRFDGDIGDELPGFATFDW